MPYWHLDTAMASLLMLLTAVDARLGACFFGIPGERTAAFRAEFGVPRSTPVGAITPGTAPRAPAAEARPGAPQARRGGRAPRRLVTRSVDWRASG